MPDHESKPKFNLSLTTAVLSIGLLIAMLTPRWDILDRLDSGMFQFGSFLLKTPSPSKTVYSILSPNDTLQNPDKIKALRLALKKIHRNKATAALMLTQPPLLDFKRKKTSSKQTTTQWQPSDGELTKLVLQLKKQGVIVGIPIAHQTPFSFIKEDDETILDYSYGLLFTKMSYAKDEGLKNNYKYNTSPYLSTTTNDHKIPLVWAADNNKIVLGLALQLYKNSLGIKKHRWSKFKGIKVGHKFIATDFAGSVTGYYSAKNLVDVKQVTLDEFHSLKNSAIRNNIFLFGNDLNSLTATANHLYSLSSKSIYHASSWSHWFKKLAFIFVFIYLILFVSKLQKQTGYLLSLFLFFSALVFQYGLLLTQAIWLPLISLFTFLFFGHFVVMLKMLNDSKIESLKLQAHDALWKLAQYQFEQGEQEKALANLLKCTPTAGILSLMYDIGLGFERRRQYDKALHLYTDIAARNNNYKDVKKRIKSLFSIYGKQPDIINLQSAQTLLMPDLGLQLPVFGRYEIERELGRGAMGVVYLGRDPKINRQVAIKTLDYSKLSESEIKTFKSRFFREAEAAGRLNHPSIVTVYDVGEESDFAFIAMDYITGESLNEFCKVGTLLPVHEVYELIASVAETLDYAHSQKIIHRDIKPSNIMYDPKTKKIKITDFGIARITDNQLTRTGSFLGSPSYMSPEQMIGSNVDHHADIYALGVSFYQLLTGCLPFTADNIGNLAHLIANSKPTSVKSIRPDLPASATRIINKALQKSAKDRYKTGKEMADAVRQGMPKDTS